MPAESRLRLLLIEDDHSRIETFRAWLPDGVILVVASSGGQAIGLLKRAEPGDFAGILLDHDLQLSARTPQDLSLSGSHLLDLVLESLPREVAVLIHSENPAGARSMAERLERAGFWVTQRPMSQLTEADFLSWVEEAREVRDE